jgi:O-antigen/teichoic acid export membrane protein
LSHYQLLKSTFIYTVTDAIAKAIPFILLPVVARYLTSTDYGILTNFSVIVQILLAICALNTYSALSVSYYQLSEQELSSYISNLVYLIFLLGLMCLAVSTVFSGVIYRYSAVSTLWQELAVLSAVSTAVFSLYTSLLRMQTRVLLFSSFQIFQALISGLLAIALVVVLQWKWQGRALSIALAAFITMVLSIVLMRTGHYLFRRLDFNDIRGAFFFGLPLLPHTLSFWFKSGMDKIIITNYVGLSANGVYSIALTLGGIIGIFTGSFFNAYTPNMFKDLSTIDKVQEAEANAIKHKLVKITYVYALTLLGVCLFSYFAMSSLIPLIFRGDYVGAIRFMPLLLTALYFEGLYSIVSGYIFYRRKTKVLGAITFTSSMVQMLLTFILVRHFGVIGAVYSSSTVALVTFLAVFTYTNILYRIPWGLNLFGPAARQAAG